MGKRAEKGEKEFCASVWILTKSSPKKVLLVHHKKFDMWLQPGGHVENNENPVETAIREVMEETGIDISFLKNKNERIDQDGTFLILPQFILEETIPEYKDQPQHFHTDIQYVVEVEETKLKHNPNESHDIRWFTNEETKNIKIHEDTRQILIKLFDPINTIAISKS